MSKVEDDLSTEQQLSLQELSMELKCLGLKTLVDTNLSNPVDLCEALINTTWKLINLVHGSAMGLNDHNQSASHKENMLRSEMQSLESKMESIEKEIKAKDKILAKERENTRQMEEDLKGHSKTVQQQKHLISQLTAKLERQEREFRHELFKQEGVNEHLRDTVRKLSGVGSVPHTLVAERIGDAIGSLKVSDMSTEQLEIQQTTLNRLKSTNHTLISENLMLRDALKMLHNDIDHVLDMAEEDQTTNLCDMLDNAFRLPLADGMSNLKELRHRQIQKLSKIQVNHRDQH